MRPAKLVRSLPGPIRSLTLASTLSATKKNGDCEVFIRLLDKHYSLMQFLWPCILIPQRKHLSTWKQQNSCHREGFLSIEHNGSGIGHVTVGPWDWSPQYIHSKTIYLHAGIKCTLRSIFTMAFHIHPKWLFYRFAHPPSFEIGFRGISGKLFINMGRRCLGTTLECINEWEKSKRLSRSNDAI